MHRRRDARPVPARTCNADLGARKRLRQAIKLTLFRTSPEPVGAETASVRFLLRPCLERGRRWSESAELHLPTRGRERAQSHCLGADRAGRDRPRGDCRFGRPDAALARWLGCRTDFAPGYQLRNRGNGARVEQAPALLRAGASKIGTKVFGQWAPKATTAGRQRCSVCAACPGSRRPRPSNFGGRRTLMSL